MPTQTSIIKIERGQFSPFFQVARAAISAASALASVSPGRAIDHLNEAITELTHVRNELRAAR